MLALKEDFPLILVFLVLIEDKLRRVATELNKKKVKAMGIICLMRCLLFNYLVRELT